MHSNQPYESLHFVKYIVDILIFIKGFSLDGINRRKNASRSFLNSSRSFCQNIKRFLKKFLKSFFPLLEPIYNKVYENKGNRYEDVVMALGR